MRDKFEEWLLWNYGFHPDMTPILNRPPMFVKQDGFFDTEAHDIWVEKIRCRQTKQRGGDPAD